MQRLGCRHIPAMPSLNNGGLTKICNSSMLRRTLSTEQTQLYLEIVEASLQIEKREQLFPFLQGCVQYLVPHEILIYGYRSGAGAYRFESYSSSRYFDSRCLGHATQPEQGLVWRTMHAWQQALKPVIVAGQPAADFEEYCIPFEEPLESLRNSEIRELLAHGITGQDGAVESFFCFARLPHEPDLKETRLLRWLTPYLHAAFMCARQLHSEKSETKSSQGQQRAVTQREQEILRWLHLGKTNWEIARILDISPMTVKNHLQNIFRKLNVQTRDQAVHKASDIGLLSADRTRAMERQI